MSRTWLILDGLQDPLLAKDLSRRWMDAGLRNAVDPAGQCGWIETDVVAAAVGPAVPADESFVATERTGTAQRPAEPALPATLSAEEAVSVAAAIARTFGIEVRDRVGETFKPDNDLPAMRQQITREYRLRLAQSLVFGLPALLIHYLGPMLASGGGQTARSMAYPWLFEMILVGWAMWTAGIPFIWQGGWSLRYLRATGDLLIFFIILAAFVPSCVGVVSLLVTSEPWFGVAAEAGMIESTVNAVATPQAAGPAFHVAMMAVILSLVQRWQLHACADRLSGRGGLLMPRFGRLIGLWLLMMLAAMATFGWHAGLAAGMTLPAMLSAGAVNRYSPGWSFALPVLAFAPVLLLGPRVMESLRPAAHLRVEVAAGFVLMLTLVMVIGWRRWRAPS